MWWIKKMNVLVQLTLPVLEINRWLVCACFPDASNDDVFILKASMTYYDLATNGLIFI